jgi:hypothetical protein
MIARARLWLCAGLLFVSVLHAEQPAAKADAGTTIVGEQESAVGLTLLPWAEEYASDLDRPPLRHDEPAVALDAQGFARRSAYHAQRTAYRREKLQRVQ